MPKQLNIKIDDYVVRIGAYDDFNKVLKLHTDGVTAEEPLTFEKIFIPCSEIVAVYNDEQITQCERCGRLVFESVYCDICHGDLYGGK